MCGHLCQDYYYSTYPEYEEKGDDDIEHGIAPYDQMNEKMEETPPIHHEHRDILQQDGRFNQNDYWLI